MDGSKEQAEPLPRACVIVRPDSVAKERIVETDARGRISLKKLGMDAHTYYKVTVLEDESVVLEPVEVRARSAATTEITPEQVGLVVTNIEAGYPSATEGVDALQEFVDRTVIPTED